MIPAYLIPPVQLGEAAHHLRRAIELFREAEREARRDKRGDVATELVGVRGHAEIALMNLPPATRRNRWRLRTKD